MPSVEVTIAGVGLRSGSPATVTLRARPGAFTLGALGVSRPLRDLVVANAERATTLSLTPAASVATVEHLFAACAALGLHEGVGVYVTGGEVPLVDGAASSFLSALRTLDVRATASQLVVVRDEVITFETSRYAFARADVTRVGVTLSFDDPRIAPDAEWDGTASQFAERIASARTFAFAHEIGPLAAAGHASHVDPGSVVVFTPQDVLVSGRPFAADEPARHKLLDLIGDLFLYGGPPVGAIHAFRPGHRATHTVLRRALAEGVVA